MLNIGIYKTRNRRQPPLLMPFKNRLHQDFSGSIRVFPTAAPFMPTIPTPIAAPRQPRPHWMPVICGLVPPRANICHCDNYLVIIFDG